MAALAFPGESARYRAARQSLLRQEIELRRLTEEVAAARRALPPGGPLPEDYRFEESGPGGNAVPVRFSQLFTTDRDSLAIYSMMFPVTDAGPQPCPSCTSFLDAFDGAAPHIAQRINLAVVAQASTTALRAHADDRGWRYLRLLSTADNTYNRDYLGETEDGSPIPMLNVFHRGHDGIRHFWGSELMYAPAEPGQDPRHSDSIDPQWNLFDLTPDGRGSDWYPALTYP